jgi:microcystin degradation protein MlrC
MRILVGSLIQESNTFSPLMTDLSFFRAGCLRFDEASQREMLDTRTELGGILTALGRAGAEVVPTVAAWASSGGPMNRADFEELTGAFLQRVRDAGRVDGVALGLHGAWAAEHIDDADGWLLGEVRRIVGRDVPIVSSLDLHANVTRQMVEAANGLIGFRTYPHIDMHETGARVAELLLTIVRARQRPRLACCKVPMIVPPENAQTTDGPLAEVVAEARRLEESGYLSASVFAVQPWLDVAELGCSIVVVAPHDRPAAQHDANRLGAMLWQRRHAFQVPLASPDEAVRRALAAGRGPVILADSADGTSSGAPGDSTAILRALVAAHPSRPALVTLVDPAAARAAAAADGREITLAVGGKLDPARHAPVTVTGRARRVADGRITFTGGIGDGLVSDMGAAAVLTVGEIRIVLMENAVPCYDPALYRTAGLEPAEAQLVVTKSPNNFRWAYRDIAREWIYVDAPGASTPRLASLTFARAPRPLFPLDDWPWQPSGASADVVVAGG